MLLQGVTGVKLFRTEGERKGGEGRESACAEVCKPTNSKLKDATSARAIEWANEPLLRFPLSPPLEKIMERSFLGEELALLKRLPEEGEGESPTGTLSARS